MSIYNHLNAGPQDRGVTPEVVIYPLNQEDSAQVIPGYILTTLPETVDRTVSYANTTWLHVDKPARDALRANNVALIEASTGTHLGAISSGKQNRITVRYARLVNSKTDAPVFNITAKNVVEFTIDQFIRDRLNLISAQQINAKESVFKRLKSMSISITKTDAEKYNKYYSEKYNDSTLLFDKERVFNLANNEPLVENPTYIQFEPDQRNKVRTLSPKCKRELIKIFKHNFNSIVNQNQTISIRDAKIINEISRQDIFDLKKGEPDLPATSRGTKRTSDVSPADSFGLPSKRQRKNIDIVNALAFPYSIPPEQAFTSETPQAELPPEQAFTSEIPRAELPQPQQVLNVQLDFEVGDELHDYFSSDSSSHIEKISPFPFKYD